MSFLNRKSGPSSVNVLGAGEHTVAISSLVETDDTHRNFNSAETESKPEWNDSTPQIACVFREISGKGVFTHRFNLKGFVRFTELTEAQQKESITVAGKPVKRYFAAGQEGYAIDRKTGERVESAERSQAAIRILDDMSARCGNPEGTEYSAMVGKELNIVIKENEQGNFRVASTKKKNAVVVIDDETV